jgi:hypothetical protein
MADLNNDGVNDTGPTTVERTTIVETGRSSGGSTLAIVVLLIVLALLAYMFRDQLGLGGNKTEISVPDSINVNVN